MSPLQEIKATAIKADGDVTVLLRQCKVFAAKLGNPEFKQWVDWELNGYPSTDVLPSYRILHVESYGHFVGPFRSEVRNVPLPPALLPEASRHVAQRADLVESISSYITLLKGDTMSNFKISWPADAVLAFGDRFCENQTCVQAWRVLSRGAIAAVIETVKNRVLSFVLDLEAEDPRVGELSANGRTLSKERVVQMFNEQIRRASKIFIGHGGRSQVWKDLRHFLTDRLHLECEEFNRQSVAGRSIKERLLEMMDSSVFAFLVMTAEDEQSDGTVRTRENVIHEVGLFQGRLGFEKAIILFEEGCSRFSNIDGLNDIRFPKGNITAVSEKIREVLEREGLIKEKPEDSGNGTYQISS